MIEGNTMSNKVKKLNLGCGEFKKEGYINIDIYPHLKPEVLHDLNKLPYPFPENEFELIEVSHVLEHLEDVFNVMRELHRILKPDGKLIIRVPHFSRGLTHPEHKRGFDVSFPYYFNPSFKGGFAGVEFQLKKMRLHWFAQQYLKKTVISTPLFIAGTLIGNILDLVANISPSFCSRIWCFWVGGFEEIEFHFTCKK